jgi:hypothetical protein
VSRGIGEIQRTILETLSHIHQQRVENAAHLPAYYARTFDRDDAAWVSIGTLAYTSFTVGYLSAKTVTYR